MTMGTEKELMSEDAQFYAELLRAYMDSANDAIFVLCDEMKFLVCNQQMQKWLGVPENELTRHNKRIPITELFGSDITARDFRENFDRTLQGEGVIRELFISPPRGIERWIEISMQKVDIEGGNMVIAVARDISEQKAYVEKIKYQATHDDLTRLANRNAIYDEIEKHVKKENPVSLIIMDIDHFKEINDGLGHEVGDSLLLTIAERLKYLTAVITNSFVARLGGDEFAILLPGYSEKEVMRFSTNIRNSLSKTFEFDTFRLSLDASIGVAQFPVHAKSSEELLRHAEVAMYHAKSRKTGVSVYDHGQDESSAEKVKLITDLRDAIQSAYLSVHYQPIVSLNDPSVFRVEALARWKHPLHGFISPSVFIPLAEQIGLIKPLTNLILGKSLAECSELLRKGAITSISVNFSPPLFNDEGISEQLSSLINMHGLENKSIKLEITESAMMSDSRLSTKNMHNLHLMGFRIAIDDFGTGLSSLFKLKDLPVSELKIDKTFITNITHDKKDAAIANAAIMLAQSLGIQVVAEGIEDEKTWHYLKEIGCDFAQGFWIAKPMPIENLKEWIRANKNHCPD